MATTYFQRFSDEIKINIFRHVKFPISLAISCKSWSNITRDSQAKAEWIIYNHGQAHAFFHAVRLGPTFINLSVARAIIVKRGILSKYFIQRLLTHFGSYDPKLIELKIEYEIGSIDVERFKLLQRKVRAPWASDLQLPVFTYLLEEASKQFEHSFYRNNDMEDFHRLSVAPDIKNNIDKIKNLILHKKFIPFPPKRLLSRPYRQLEACYIQLKIERPDGYESIQNLNIIAQAILKCDELVHIWKEIGYYEICDDVNDLVIRGALLILCQDRPDDKVIVERLKRLIDIGFQLSYSVIGDMLYLFECRLEDIGRKLIESFMYIKGASRENFLDHCLVESLRPERNTKKHLVWDFLYTLTQNYTETLFIKACGHYWDKNVNLNIPITQLTLPSKFYAWVLTKFGVDAKITKLCFEDILKARINIDKQLQQTPNVKIPIEMNPNVFYELCGILRAYNKAKNFYLPLHLNIISQCKAAEILMPLFKCHLPKLFKESIDSNMLHEWEDVLHMLHNNLSESTEEFKSYFLGFINRKK